MTHELGAIGKEGLVGLQDIPAYVLAGGLGSRMDMLTHDLIPKSLVEIKRGKVLLDYIFDIVRTAGIKEVVICASHQSDKIVEYYSLRDNELNIKFSVEEAPRGVIKSFERGINDFIPTGDFVLLHGDEIITNFSLIKMCNFHRSHGGIATGLLSRNPQAGRTVVMRLENNCMVSDSLRDSVGDHPDYLSSLGLFIFRPEIINEVGRFSTWEEMVKTLAKEEKLYGFTSDAFFFNINIPDDIAEFVKHKSGNGSLV